MKLTKKLEVEIKVLMEDYWQSYLTGDLSNWASYLVDDYQNIGTTEAEIWKSKKEIYDYTSSILDQMVGLTEVRNKKTEIIPYDSYFMVHEFLDIYIRAGEEWIFYSKVRMSSLIKKIDNSWKILHQHGSYPDSKIIDGEFFAFDTLKSENLKLQEAVKNRTIELEAKNHDLEIEASLERVRAVAMGMKKSEDLLNICEVSFKELQKLGFDNLRNALIHIPNDEQKYLMDYDYSEFTGGDIAKIAYGSHPIVDEYIEKIQSAKDAYFEVVISKDQLSDWKEFRKSTGQSDDSRLDKAEALYYYLFSIGIGDIGISTFKPIDETQLKILQRFRNVFDLAYKRYDDIRRAEAQTREAQIEAALERVRTRAMAMNSSNDMTLTADTFFSELINLNIKPHRCGFGIVDRETRTTDVHATTAKEDNTFEVVTGKLKLSGHPVLDKIFEGFEKQEEYHPVLKGKEIAEYYAVMNPQVKFPEFSDDEIQYGYYFYFKEGGAFAWTDTEFLESELEIFRRFTTVLSLTYRRYQDIKNAEAQARKAQIEMALEKVRSRSIAMRKSEELADLSFELVKQVHALGIDTWFCAFNIYDDEIKGSLEWGSNLQGTYKKYRTPREGIFLRYYEAGQKGEILLINEINEDECPAHYEYLCTVPGVGEQLLKMKEAGIPFPTSQIDHVAYFKYGYIIFITFESVPGAHEIFKRFANLFEQSYTRFLDLKKAEAQAREAQIEAGLERARAQSMMMQHSEELNKTSQVFHEQLRLLGIDSEFSYLWLPDEVKNEHLFWATWQEVDEGSVIFRNKKVIYPLDKTEPAIAECYVAWESGMPVHVNPVPADGVELYFNTWSELLEGVDKFKPELYPNGLYYIDAYMKYGCFGIMIRKQLSEDEQKVLHRFSTEFERAYTRFLDLQRAEEQAREAQIEMSLEKVRNVALQLKKSDEMLDIAQVLYEQLLDLGFKNIRNAIIDIKNGDDDTFTDYDYSHEMSGTITQMSYHDDPTLKGQFKKMASTTNDFFELVLEGKELDDLKAMRIKNGEDEDPRLNNIDILTYNLYSFGNGAIGISNFGVLTEEEKSILNRFSNVFTFAYKRYTDLVQAELQAREALIELSLERIRAKVTAMKESNELLDIVVTMRSEFVKLGHEAHYFWYMRYLPEMYEKAMTSGDGTKIGMVMTLPRHIHGEIKLLADWEKSGDPTVVFAMDTETAVNYVHKMITLGDFKQVDPNAPTLDDIRHIGGLTFIMARTDHGEIGYSLPGVVPDPPAEDLNILVRFAGVFDLAYKRFEDLKNSELRNREAIIELSLERVRVRTMAMQKSNELAQTAAYLFSQLNILGINPYGCNIAIVDEGLKTCRLWFTTNSGNVITTGSVLSLNEFSILQDFYEGWKTKKPYHEIKLVGKTTQEWKKYISKYFPFKKYNSENTDEKDLVNNSSFLYNLYFKQGFFTIHSKEELIDDQLNIIQRFANVFEQTYTRYMDLENSEKQNKIIQAENERKTEELEEARQLQLAMLPKELPKLPNLDIAVYMKTATEVGGDYYDFHVDAKNNFTAIIGDATGHGMKAGTMVTITKSLFNSLASSKDIIKTFKRISEVIKNMQFRQLSMCLQMIKISGSELSISSAAMPPVFIYDRSDNCVEEILLSGMPLGAMINYQYKIEKRKLKSGDIIFLLSDGLPELHNAKKVMYGYDRIKTELAKVGKKSSKEIIKHFEKSAADWLNGSEQDDDVTFVVIKIK